MSLTYNMKLYDQGCMVAVKNVSLFFFFLLFGDNSSWTKNGVIDLNHLNAKIAIISPIKNFNEKVGDHFAASKTRCKELI